MHLSSDVTDYLLHMEQEKEKYKQKAALDTNMKKTKDAKDKTTRAKGKSAKENDTRSFPDNQLPSSCRMSLSQATLMRQQVGFNTLCVLWNSVGIITCPIVSLAIAY